MSIEQKIAKLLEESKKLQAEEQIEGLTEEQIDLDEEDFTISEEEFAALSEEEKANYELLPLDEISSELKQRYVNKVEKRLTSKRGSRDHDAYTGRTYTGRETSDMFHRGKNLDKHVQRANKIVDKMKEELNVDVSADVAALVNGEDLTEEFKTKAATIFEAAVVTRVKAELAKIEEQFEAQLEEQVEQITEGIVEKVDGYLNYVVEQWMTDNELALENGIKAEILESFVSGMKGLFEQHYIDMPEEKFDVLSELEEQAEELKSKLDEQLASNVELTKKINEMARQTAIAEASDGMADTDAEKFNALAEELSFEDTESFKAKLQTIKENYFGKKVAPTVNSPVTDEPVTLTEEKTIDPVMAHYLRALKK